MSTIDLDQLITRPPQLRFRTNDGDSVYEPQLLVGWLSAPESARRQLEEYGVYMDIAEHDRCEGRWNQCLFSEAVADMLSELSEEGQFPYAFEAVPSAGCLVLLETGLDSETPPMPLRSWVTPALVDALARAVAAGKLRSAWLRRSANSTQK